MQVEVRRKNIDLAKVPHSKSTLSSIVIVLQLESGSWAVVGCRNERWNILGEL